MGTDGDVCSTEEFAPPLSARHKPSARRERGSLFSRLRLGGGGEEAGEEAAVAARNDGGADGSMVPQQLEAMSDQLEAVTACMKVEQQARVAAETQLLAAREQVQGLLKHLNEMEKVRRDEADTLSALRGLLGQIQSENAGLKEQNANLVAQCRSLMGGAKNGSAGRPRRG